MKFFILSDIHSNLEALEAVLQDMKRFKPDFKNSDTSKADCLIDLGDTIGYMSNPNECMDKIYSLTDKKLIGNHEIAIAEELSHPGIPNPRLNERAAWAIRWNANNLSELNRKRILSLFDNGGSWSYIPQDEGLIFSHAVPFNPDSMEYITGKSEAFSYFFAKKESDSKLAFVGHLHIPQIYVIKEKGLFTDPSLIIGGNIVFNPRQKPSLSSKRKSLELRLTICEDNGTKRRKKKINLSNYSSVLTVVPSVGQPRDSFNYAGYTVYDSLKKEMIMVRVEYDIKKTQEKMRSLNFPERLWQRLWTGN